MEFFFDWDEHLVATYYLPIVHLTKHMAHTIPINVWVIPTHAYKISTTYLHQRKYYC
jgi:hypothetical protein